MEKQLLFKVVEADGHVYSIYTNGETEGFGDSSTISNSFPALLRDALARHCVQQEDSLPLSMAVSTSRP